MKALVTLENGQMFQIDMHDLLLTAIDKLGNPISTKPLQRLPVAVPGCRLAFARSLVRLSVIPKPRMTC